MTVVAADCGYLSIVGASRTVPLQTYAWAFDARQLMGSGAPRGTDTVVPGLAGVLANPRRRTVTEYTLPGTITGYYDEDGTAQSAPAQKLHDWLYLLQTELVEGSSGLIGPVLAATYHEPDGSTTRTGSIRVLEIEATDTRGPDVWVCQMVVSLPFGRLARP